MVDESFNPVLTGQYLSLLAVQSDGKLLAVVNASSGLTFQQQLLRFLADGTLDTAYTSAVAKNIGVSLSRPLGGGYPAGITALIQQTDGKLLVAGSFAEGGTAGYHWNQSWRVNPDGTVDSSYTPHVVASFPVPGVAQDLIPQVQLSDGRYLTIGTSGIVRLLVNGAVDSTFTAYVPPGPDFITSSWQLVGGVGGKIFLERNPSPGNAATTIDRLNGDGTLDSTFTPTTVQGQIQIAQVLPSGQSIVISRTVEVFGGVEPVTTGTIAIQRLNANGTVDNTYPGLSLPLTINGDGIPWGVLATTLGIDGSFYVDLGLDSTSLTPAPITLVQGTYHQGLIRIDPSGNFDPSYSLNFDLQPTPPTARPVGLNPSAAGLASSSNGQFYFWNTFVGFNGEPRAALVRINPSVGANFASLANLSALGSAGQGSAALTVGFVQSGSANKTMLLRGIGPGLTPFGIPGALSDPLLTLFDASANVQLTNNNWQDGGQGLAVAAADTAVGAFALANGSLDAALVTALAPGAHTFAVSGVGTTSGIALAEAYDADPTHPVYGGARAINFSFRAQVANGSAALTAGFVITGNNLKRVLIRAIGPSLASFNIGTPIPDPVLTLHAGTLSIAQNQQWGGQLALSTTFADVGAFALPSASADSAVVLNLPPGDYTAEVTSASGTMGLTMIEIYEVP